MTVEGVLEVEMHLSAIIEAQYHGKWEKEIPQLKTRVGPFQFMLGPVPMTVSLVVPVNVGFVHEVTAYAEARSTLSASRRVLSRASRSVHVTRCPRS
jgi:hypothetical protein